MVTPGDSLLSCPGKAAALLSLREGQKVNCPQRFIPALYLSHFRPTLRRSHAKLLKPFLASQWPSCGFSSPDGVHLRTRGHDFQHIGEARVAVEDRSHGDEAIVHSCKMRAHA